VNPHYATIITAIDPGRVADLRAYLRTHVEPSLNEKQDALACQEDFRFDQVGSLHFCSFVTLDADGEEGLPPYLIFEATFDGSREDFIDEMLRVAPKGMHTVYEHCDGYPQAGMVAPTLVKEYLIFHDVGANTFFSGSRGRSASQIKRESELRRKLVEFLGRRRPGGMPGTLAGLQQLVQNDFVRQDAANRWAEDAAVVPWPVAYRSITLRVVAVLALALLCVVGIVIFCAFGLSGRSVVEKVRLGMQDLGGHLPDFVSGSRYGARVLGRLEGIVKMPTLYALLGLTLTWFVVRFAELWIRQKGINPRRQTFLWRYSLFLARVARSVVLVFLIGFACLAIAEGSAHVKPQQGQLVVATTAWVFGGAVVALVALWYWATSLKLKVELRELSYKREARRRFWLEVVQFLRVIVLLVAILAIARHFRPLLDAAQPAGRWIVGALVLTVWATTGFLAFYLMVFVLALAVRALERADRKRFASANELINVPLSETRKYSREDGGINRHQNHLASLTYVKPGRLRNWLLRAILFVVNLNAYYRFNRGELRGIPTILSARWVLIDDNRRLLFLDNFSGAWDSYLNEFIDLGAVKGLNAVWTNTFVKGAGGKQYAFPETEYHLWRGAQAERPFKAYVRKSQVETLAWYSAYHTLSIININTNTDIRQALFKPLASHELDAIVGRL
jgi:hypothetical protein